MHGIVPDLLLITCDQLSALALGRGDTPRIDALAAAGTSFARAYTTCPLCMPARASMWTGLLPHRTGITSNGRWMPIPAWRPEVPTLGGILRAAGWDCRHVGKTHDAGSLAGFACQPERELPVEPEHPAWPLDYDTRRDAGAVADARAQLAAIGPDDGRRCLAVELNNPHDICGWVGAYHGGNRLSPPGALPELPANHAPEEAARLPRPLQYLCCAHNRQAQASGFAGGDLQRYLAAYRHYVRRADAAVGEILDALAASGRAERTLVVFWADHGDGMAAHGLVTKHTAFYEESVRIPFVVAGPGIVAGRRIDDGLFSLADLLPTLCGLLGLPAPAIGDGLDLAPVLRGGVGTTRRQVAAEWLSEWGATIEPGRMLCDGRWKYVHYREGDGEQLFDLMADPGETCNRVADPAAAGDRERMRAALAAHLAATEDPYLGLDWLAEPRWRQHAPGHAHHQGPAAPMVRLAADPGGNAG